MINLWLVLGITLFIITTNYAALIYGIRLGKAMQKDIPASPAKPVAEAIKKAFKLIRDRPHKSYFQKKAPKQDDDTNPLFN